MTQDPQPASLPPPGEDRPPLGYAKATPREGRGFAIAGVVLGALSFLYGVRVQVPLPMPRFLDWTADLSDFGLVAGLVAVVLGVHSLLRWYPHRRLGWVSLGLGTMGCILLLIILKQNNAREHEIRTMIRSQSNLREISTAFMIYTQEHNDLPPPDLEPSLARYVRGSPPSPFVSPRSGKRAYVYINPGRPIEKIIDPGRTILVYEDPLSHGGAETCPCFADFHTEQLPADSTFWDMVKDAKRKAAIPPAPPVLRPEGDVQGKVQT